MNFLRKIIFKLKFKINHYLLPEVKSFDEADRFSISKNRSNYDSNYLSNYRFKKLEKFIKNDGNLLQNPSANMLLYAVSLFIKKNPGKIPKLVDYGGACGESILLLASIFGKDIYKNSWVIESPNHVKEAKKHKFLDKVQFSDNFIEILDKTKIDIFFSSCALHYLPDPCYPLKVAADNNIQIVCLTRNNFSFKPSFYVQLSKLSLNGTGAHLMEYQDKNIYYPVASLSESNIVDIFVNKNYAIYFQKKGTQSGVINKKFDYSKDLCFYLKK